MNIMFYIIISIAFHFICLLASQSIEVIVIDASCFTSYLFHYEEVKESIAVYLHIEWDLFSNVGMRACYVPPKVCSITGG